MSQIESKVKAAILNLKGSMFFVFITIYLLLPFYGKRSRVCLHFWRRLSILNALILFRAKSNLNLFLLSTLKISQFCYNWGFWGIFCVKWKGVKWLCIRAKTVNVATFLCSARIWGSFSVKWKDVKTLCFRAKTVNIDTFPCSAWIWGNFCVKWNDDKELCFKGRA